MRWFICSGPERIRVSLGPQHWPGKRYDVTWVFTPKRAGGWALEQFPQQLLLGDSAEVIAQAS